MPTRHWALAARFEVKLLDRVPKLRVALLSSELPSSKPMPLMFVRPGF